MQKVGGFPELRGFMDNPSPPLCVHLGILCNHFFNIWLLVPELDMKKYIRIYRKKNSISIMFYSMQNIGNPIRFLKNKKNCSSEHVFPWYWC